MENFQEGHRVRILLIGFSEGISGPSDRPAAVQGARHLRVGVLRSPALRCSGNPDIPRTIIIIVKILKILANTT